MSATVVSTGDSVPVDCETDPVLDESTELGVEEPESWPSSVVIS